jgi:hypothetical protein
MAEIAGFRDAMAPDQLDALGDEIATFAARIDIAEHALITRLRLFDAHDAWANSGFLSCAHWLSWRVGLGLKAAREKVRVARALGALEKVDALFGRGALSYSKVRAITRVATAQTEQDFIDIAVDATAAQLERLTRSYQRCTDLADQASEPPRSQRRFVRRAETLGGMVRIEMQLPPEEAALVWEAMMSASDGVFGSDTQASAEASGNHAGLLLAADASDAEASAETSASHATPRLALVASDTQASAEASASDAGPQPAFADDPDEPEQRRADAIVNVARAYLKHRPRTLGSGYELVVITSKEQLEHGPGGVGGFLRDGTPVPLHVARRLACDSARIDVVVGEHGELLDVGRRARSIPSAIGRALWLRDGGCRVPGCGRKQHLHGHHIQEWAEGGPTALSNLVLVCPGHHRMIHEGTLRSEIRDGKIVFSDQRGRSISTAPPSAATGQDLEALELFLRDADLHIDPSMTMPKWDGAPMNLADSLSWMFIADHTRGDRLRAAVASACGR